VCTESSPCDEAGQSLDFCLFCEEGLDWHPRDAIKLINLYHQDLT